MFFGFLNGSFVNECAVFYNMLCGRIDYKCLEIYQLAHEYVLFLYPLCDSFPQHESNNLASQLRRAVVSLPLNIAEGSGCMSHRSFLNFLSFAYRSLLEIEATLRLCRELKYLSEEQHKTAWTRFNLLIRKLYRYMECIQAKADARTKHRTQIEQEARRA
jgi:four helix bundle protein